MSQLPPSRTEPVPTASGFSAPSPAGCDRIERAGPAPDAPRPGLPRRVLGALAEVIVAVYIVADAAVSLLLRPLMRFLSGLRIVQRLERGINALHPYVILVVMAVPFAIAEVAKVFAVYWMAEGHMRSGMTIFIGAYVVSILVCERILHAGKPKLMTIPWFAFAYNWVMVVKEHVFGWFRGTAVWRAATALRDRARDLGRRAAARLRSAFEGRPRGALQGRPGGAWERR